ncbi:hypothetical protein HW555_012797 [Spodoptera exigua]|uniref:Uncharacterized protein n=1 Tax=Spodoptera exigua TaxID=7107 RepID=A0A835G4T6_SPOEX|nr:hypothetical protein HW555_012797 [Spodoptera exigua]
MAFKNVWKLAGGGAGWRRSSAHCGNSAAKRCATLIFANNMNSSTIEFCLRPLERILDFMSFQKCNLLTWNLISGDDSDKAPLSRRFLLSFLASVFSILSEDTMASFRDLSSIAICASSYVIAAAD